MERVPERLSRGLALVKWWLLAIPHYVVVGLIVGPQVSYETVDGTKYASHIGLIGILVLVAAVVLLFTNRYPRSVYDLVLGLNRWVFRVMAYAGLSDHYLNFGYVPTPFGILKGTHKVPPGCRVEVVEARSAVGGGTLPGVTLPTFALALPPGDPDGTAARLRAADPPVVARIDGGRVLLDPRTVLPGEDEAVLAAVRGAVAAPKPTA